jgi:MYXO-CTERM domain-containing protein
MDYMKKFQTITLAVALTTALSMGAAGVQATHMDTGNAVGTGSPIGTLGTGTTGTTTSTGYTGSNYDATSPGMGLGTGVSNFSGNGTNGVYNGNLTTPNTYSGYGTTGRGTGVMDHMNGYGTNPVEKGANAVERGVERGANAVERGVDRSANMVDRMSTKSLSTATPSTNGNSYRAYATTDNDNDMSWGWLGLVGLLGLAGLRSNNKRRDESYK